PGPSLGIYGRSLGSHFVDFIEELPVDFSSILDSRIMEALDVFNALKSPLHTLATRSQILDLLGARYFFCPGLYDTHVARTRAGWHPDEEDRSLPQVSPSNGARATRSVQGLH